MKKVSDMVAEANKLVNCVSEQEAIKMYKDPSVLFVDLRDIRELQREGVIPGAFHCPRGMLEFWVDKESPYAKQEFQQQKKFVFFCAGGARSALAARTAQEMGLKGVNHITTGFGGWKQAGGKIEPLKRDSD